MIRDLWRMFIAAFKILTKPPKPNPCPACGRHMSHNPSYRTCGTCWWDGVE